MVKKIKGVFKIIICICVFVAAFLGIKNFFPYERCYFKVIGVNENKAIGRDVINCLGEPLLTTTDEDGHGQYYYDGLIVTCNSRTPNTHVRKIEITSKKHGFGL